MESPLSQSEDVQAGIDKVAATDRIRRPKKPKAVQVISDLIAEGAALLSKPVPPPLPPRPMTALERLQRDPDIRRLGEQQRLYTMKVTPKDVDEVTWVKGVLESVLKAHVAGKPKLGPLTVKHIRLALKSLVR
jgi:hypothetical protein